jgi:hypothetical protein
VQPHHELGEPSGVGSRDARPKVTTIIQFGSSGEIEFVLEKDRLQPVKTLARLVPV